MDIEKVYREMKTKQNPQGRQMSLYGKNISFTTRGKYIVDQDNNTFVVRGVSKPGFEYFYIDYNIYNNDMFDYDIGLMIEWRINTVRIPLRDEHWLTNHRYRELVRTLITKLINKSILVIIDLHTQGDSLGLDPFMKRSQHAKRFWKDISQEFRNIPVIFFEIFNEPFDITPDIWWNGNEEYHGYKEMLTLIRQYAQNICILGGLDWAFQWGFLNYHQQILDELLGFDNIVLSTHPYGYKGKPHDDGVHTHSIPTDILFPQDTTGDCSLGVTFPKVSFHNYGWNESFGYLHDCQLFPIVATEFGLDRPDNCLQGGWYNYDIVKYFNQHKMGYVAWAWVDERLDYPSLLTKEFLPTGKASFQQEGPACGYIGNHFYKGPGDLVFHDLKTYPKRVLHSQTFPANECSNEWNIIPFLLGVIGLFIWYPYRQRDKDKHEVPSIPCPPTRKNSNQSSIRIRSCSSLQRLCT